MTRDEFRSAMRLPLRKFLQAGLREEATRTRVLVTAGAVVANHAAATVTEAAILEISDTLFDAFGADRAQEAQPS